ncbi:MAG TPA: radical SAM protein [Verrucomicrobiae bacterium]|nr:radical SAM protein [Verrucomicrobiae bacterium]
MSVVLINPNQVVQANDPFTTGVVYMPLTLANAAASLRADHQDVHVIDAYAEAVRQVRRFGNFLIFGLRTDEVLERMPSDVQAIVVYAINLTNHISTRAIVRTVKRAKPNVPVVVLENTQAVTAYALRYAAKDFYDAGADFICTGESDQRIVKLVRGLQEGRDTAHFQVIDGVGTPAYYTPPAQVIADLDQLPFPAWDLFPVKNYWGLRFAHGPQSSERYLPLLTSRGCPYPCKFCVVLATNNQKWRPRSPKNVVDEMEHWVRTMDVREFHIEDLDPTISDDRIRGMCSEILRRQLPVTWKIVAGTKVETIRTEETIDRMSEAGCRYISISPETGSPRILKEMRKPFDLEHAVRMVKRMNERNIRSQACFVLGFPTETDEDRAMTYRLVRDLTRRGVDEIALFIITPVPGSALYQQFAGYTSFSDLNFSPTWRPDYAKLNAFRFKLYRQFLIWKLIDHPCKIARQIVLFLIRRFETKMEMVPYRALCFARWARSGAEPLGREETLAFGDSH